jgi:hypothetical protein
MSKDERCFSQGTFDWFSPSLHWHHCLLLEDEILQLLKYVPIDSSMPKENLAISSPKLVDIFSKTCFLLEAAFKGISKDPTDRIINFIQASDSSLLRSLLNGLNCKGKKKKLDICDFLSFYEQYCSLKKLELRIKYFGNISDVWINNMIISRPYMLMEFKDQYNEKPPSWWTIYNDIKHNFYSYSKYLNLGITLDALAGLIAFTAVVPQMRRLLCDHGFIKDDHGKPITLEKFGKKIDGKFQKDEMVRHDQLVLADNLDDISLPPIACVSNLFVVQFAGDYKHTTLWSGLR